MKRKKVRLATTTILFFCLATGLAFYASGVSAETPKPGDVINSANIDQCASFFPEFMQRYIQDGWGFEDPAIVHLQGYQENLLPKSFRDATEKNRGKVTLNTDGTLSGYNYEGFPFAEIEEPNKALKIMWNNFYKYKGDDFYYKGEFLSSGKRKGGKVTYASGRYFNIKYVGRLTLPPVNLENPLGLFWSSIFQSKAAGSKDMMTLTWRYLDPIKSDDMWAYIPTLRRTIRMVSSERSNPISGTSMTYDDQFGWDGNIFNFEYKLIEEKPLIQVVNWREDVILSKYPRGYDKPVMNGPDFPYELRDVYVIEVAPKDSRYPESKRYLWILKENFFPSYFQNYDKSGELWKGMANVLHKIKTGQGETAPWMSNAITDFKTGTWNWALSVGAQTDAGMEPGKFSPGVFYRLK